MAAAKSSVVVLFSGAVLLLSMARLWDWVQTNTSFTLRTETSPLITSRYDCSHNYTVEILSFDPWVMYINDFVSQKEIDHLLEITKNQWSSSEVFHKPDDSEDVTFGVDKDSRNSSSAFISGKDPVGKCLLRRTKSLLGNVQHDTIELPQFVRYTGGERFRPHMDTIDPQKAHNFLDDFDERPWNRLLSAFVYLGDDCVGGETYFPRVPGVGPEADGDKFSRTKGGRQGLLVKPRKGNAIVWKNLFANGSVDDRLVHAGLAVRSGEKVGMNLFTRYYFDAPMVG